jgi:predicted TIM-barrel fold metal-dependent hydrolase
MYYPDEKVLLTDQNRALWEEIASLGAVIQFHLNAQFADQVDQIARRCPSTVFILDHMGYPQVGAEGAAFQPILDLAQNNNVYLKLSDVKGRSKQGFPYADVHPYIELLVQAFGTGRMVWGTGYPGHHRLKHNWPTLQDELRLVSEGLPFLSAAEQDHILGGTAAEIWNLS